MYILQQKRSTCSEIDSYWKKKSKTAKGKISSDGSDLKVAVQTVLKQENTLASNEQKL